jgi:hypothetical protein
MATAITTYLPNKSSRAARPPASVSYFFTSSELRSLRRSLFNRSMIGCRVVTSAVGSKARVFMPVSFEQNEEVGC